MGPSERAQRRRQARVLGEPARDALRRIEAQGDEAIDEAAWAAGRAVLDKDYEAVLDRGLANYKPTIPADASEDEILAEAVRITRRR